MSDLGIKIIINIIVGIIVFVGFFRFFGNSNGWFVEGGLVYEWNKARKAKKAAEKKAAQSAKRAAKNAKKSAKTDGPIRHQ